MKFSTLRHLKQFVASFIAFVMAAFFTIGCKSNANRTIPYTMTTIGENSKFATVEIQYPQFRGEAALNAEIEQIVTRPYNDFASSAEQIWTETDEFRKELGETTETPPFEYRVATEPILNGTRYISMLFTTYQFTGGAHGSTTLASLTYDRQTQKTISIEEASGMTLADIAKKCNDYFSAELNYGGDDAESNETRSGWITDGTAPSAENYRTFTFDGKTLTVYFEPYLVAPYSEGVQSVEIAVQ